MTLHQLHIVGRGTITFRSRDVLSISLILGAFLILDLVSILIVSRETALQSGGTVGQLKQTGLIDITLRRLRFQSSSAFDIETQSEDKAQHCAFDCRWRSLYQTAAGTTAWMRMSEEPAALNGATCVV